MKQKIEDHQKIQTYANTIKEIADTAIREHWKTNELKQNIFELCTKCLSPATSDCKICNGVQYNLIHNLNQTHY